MERSGQGGSWCHQQCDICRKTAPLLPRAPTRLPSALEQCQRSLKLLSVLHHTHSISKLLSPCFPPAPRSHSEISIRIRPNSEPSAGFKGEACHFYNDKIHFMLKPKTFVLKECLTGLTCQRHAQLVTEVHFSSDKHTKVGMKRKLRSSFLPFR